MDLIKEEIEFNCTLPLIINQVKPTQVLIKMVEEGYTRTKSGLILSSTGADQPDKLNIGRVIRTGAEVSPAWKPGDLVAFSQYGGIKLPINLMPDDRNEYMLTDESSLFFSFHQVIENEDLKKIER